MIGFLYDSPNPLALTQDPALWYPAQTHAASRKKAGGPREKKKYRPSCSAQSAARPSWTAPGSPAL